MKNQTIIEYLYRDASNYKFWGDLVVNGPLVKRDLTDFLFDGEYFVPSEVGLSHLLDLPINEDDHLLHEFASFTPISGKAPLCTASELIERFRAAHRRGWFSQIIEYERRDQRSKLE